MWYVGTKLTLSGGAMNALLRSRGGPVGRDMFRRAQNVARVARKNAPVGKVSGGRLKASIVPGIDFDRVPIGTVKATAKHAMWVSKGTGIYAGHGYIRPKTARYMIFSTAYGRYNLPSSGGYYYATAIKGQKANSYLQDSLPAAAR